MASTEYIIRVKGHLPAGWSELFEGMEFRQEEDGDTLLTGQVRDQAALYGLLIQIENLGLTLVAINPVTGSQTSTRADKLD